MAGNLDPKGAADVFTSQMFAMIALANSLVEARVVDGKALISALLDQRKKLADLKSGPQFLVPLDAMIGALRREESKRVRN